MGVSAWKEGGHSNAYAKYARRDVDVALARENVL